MARVPRGEYHFIARALDVGALGVMVPMVGTADEAAHIVVVRALSAAGPARRGVRLRARRLPGRRRRRQDRGAARAHAGDRADRDRRGPRNVEAIAAVPGIDVLWLGHFDLTNFLGIPGAVRPSGLSGRGRRGSSPRANERARPRRSSPPTSARRATTSRVASGCSAYGIDQLMLQEALRAGLAVLRDVGADERSARWRKFRVGIDARHPRFTRRSLRSALRRSTSSTAPSTSNGNICRSVVREITRRPRGALRRALRQHRRACPAAAVARADRRLRVVARHGVGLRLGRRAGDDARRRRRHQHAGVDAAAGRDDRADVHARARRQADAARTG